MTRRWVLSDRAETALTEIMLWTADRFGPRQAATYRDLLIARMNDLAGGRAVAGRLSQLTHDARHDRYGMLRFGRHLAILKAEADLITVIDVLHVRSDLPGHAGALPDPDDV